MGRSTNGSTEFISAAIDLSAWNTLTFAAWIKTSGYAANNKSFFCHTSGSAWNTAGSFLIDPDNQSVLLFEMDAPSYARSVGRPSSGVWLHYMVYFDRATPQIKYYLGGLLTSTNSAATGTPTGNFSNGTLYMGRAPGLGYHQMVTGHVAIWGGVQLGAGHARSLAAGVPPSMVGIKPSFYWPIFGADSPEPDYSGSRVTAALTNACPYASGPPVQPGVIVPRRGFQPVPV